MAWIGNVLFHSAKFAALPPGCPPPKQHLLDEHDPNALLSTNELASLTGFRPKTIRRWVSRRLLNYIRVGNRLRFRLASVELFLAQREVRK